jgi:small subunit ribosomal protein S6
MREYEFVYVLQPDATAEREGEIHSRLDNIISRGGGTYLIREDWGKRKLAYEIRKFQKGHYFQVNFLADGSFIPDLERMMRLDSDVLRFLTVQANDRVKDIEARIAEAKEQEKEHERRREERERLEAERLQREAEAEAARHLEAEAEEGLGEGLEAMDDLDEDDVELAADDIPELREEGADDVPELIEMGNDSASPEGGLDSEPEER